LEELNEIERLYAEWRAW